MSQVMPVECLCRIHFCMQHLVLAIFDATLSFMFLQVQQLALLSTPAGVQSPLRLSTASPHRLGL